MASINLTIKSNFEQASKEIKGYSELTERELKRIKTALGKIKGDEIDSFIQKNQRAATAVTATRGKMEGLKTEQAGLRREIEKLIRNGMDPQEEAMQELRKEYERATREIEIQTKAVEASNKAYDISKKALLGMGVALIGGGTAALKFASEIEDATAAFQPLVGGLEQAEGLVDQLNKTAATTPFQFNDIAAAAKQLLPVMEGDLENTVETFRMLGDTAGGNAQKLESITRGYTKAMLKNKVDMESLNMIAEAGVPIYTELADSMGITVEELTKMSAAGTITSDDLTEAFQKMTSEGGIFFEGMEIASATLSGKMSTLQDNVKLSAAALGDRMLPAAKGMIDRMIQAAQAVTAFVQDSQKMERLLNVILPIIGGIAAGFASFLIITKVIAVIRGLSTAMAVLNAVLAANPVILIAAGIAAVVAAIIVLIRNWDKVVVFMETTIAKLQARWEQFGVALGSTWTRAINNLKVVFLELGGIILEKVLGAVNKLLDLASRIPVIGEKFAGLQDNVNGFAESLDQARQNAIANSQAVIENAKLEQAAAKEKADATVAAIKEESAARMAALREQEEEAAGIQTEINAAELEALKEQEDLKTEIETTALTERLAVLHDLEAQAQLDNMATFQEFLEARMEQEGIASEQKIAFLQSELERINELEGISNAERLAASKQVESMITAEQKKQFDARMSLMQKTANAFDSMFTGISDLTMAFAGENRKAAVFAKNLAHVQAGINSALAMTQVLADPTLPTFIKVPAALGILASGIAQQKQIADAPIPTAQTGTGMSGVTVPGNGKDQIGVMMAPGETAHISPRGENGGKPMHITVQIGRAALIDEIINPAIESQDIRITTDNIQGGAVVA